METLKDLTEFAGPIALAAFAGTLLGGIALSFFWKNFGPWKLLEACREECAKCHEEREELLKLYEKIVREDLGITRLMLFERTDHWLRILAFGTTPADDGMDVEQAFSRFSDIQVIDSESAGSLGAFDVAVPVHHRDRPLAFLLIGDIDEEEQRISPTVKHLNYIQTLTNLIVVAMENRRLADQALQRQRDKRELELAREMPSLLFSWRC